MKLKEEILLNKQNIFIIFFKFNLIFLLIIIYIKLYGRIFNINLFVDIIKDFTNIYSSSYDRIFLCTLYNNEAEMAYIQLWRLYEYVDRFIILVSNMTYSGLPKNISFKPFEQNMRPFMNKVDIVNFNNICNRKEYPDDDNIWCFENSQRDYAKTFIEEHYNPTEKDLLIIVDIDEILTREGIKYLRDNPPYNFKFIKGTSYFPYYYHKIIDWNKGFIIRYNKQIKSFSKYRLMNIKNYNILKFKNNPTKPLITHCTYCFKNIEEFKNKLNSFSHKEYNRPPYNTNNWIFKSQYCRETFKHQGYDEPYEGWKHLIPDDERLKYLIDRSFIFPLYNTTYKEKDLESLCKRTYNRTPFEFSAKYQYF